MKHEKIFFIICTGFLFASCNTTRILPNKPAGTKEYRDLETEIGAGQTELVTAGKDIESTSKDIGESIKDIKSAGEQLEQSIAGSDKSQPEITEILQSVRNRKLPDNIINELRKSNPNIFLE